MSVNRKQWAAMLAKLTAPMAAADAARAIADMLPMMADLPDEAFTTASLESVASQCRRVPTYAELRSALGVWWLNNRPAQPAISGPEKDHWERHDLPKPRTAPTSAELAVVGEALAGLRMELAERRVSAAIAASKPKRMSAELTDSQLLAIYDGMGKEGANRARMLRAKLGNAGSSPPNE